MSNYKAPIGRIPSSILILAFRLAGAFTNKITHLPSKKIVEGLLENTSEVIRALSDSDPTDELQIKSIVHGMITSGQFYEGSRESILANIAKIKNDPAREVLQIALDEVYAIGRILVDFDDDNGRQVKERIAGFIRTAEGVEFITSLLDIALDENTAAVIAIVIIEALEAVLKDDGVLDKLRSLKEKYNSKLGVAE